MFGPRRARSALTNAAPTCPGPGGSMRPRANTTSAGGHVAAFAAPIMLGATVIGTTTAVRAVIGAANIRRPITNSMVLTVLSRIGGCPATIRRQSSQRVAPRRRRDRWFRRDWASFMCYFSIMVAGAQDRRRDRVTPRRAHALLRHVDRLRRHHRRLHPYRPGAARRDGEVYRGLKLRRLANQDRPTAPSVTAWR